MAYFAGIVFSAMLHMVVLSALWVNWQQPTEKVFIQPKYINAELVKLAPVEQKRSSSRQQKTVSPQVQQNSENEVTKTKKHKDKNEIAKKKELAAEKRKLDADKKRIKEDREAKRRHREAEWEEALAQAEAQLEAEEDERAANSFRQVIQKRLSENWSRPPSARRGMETQIRIAFLNRCTPLGIPITAPVD